MIKLSLRWNRCIPNVTPHLHAVTCTGTTLSSGLLAGRLHAPACPQRWWLSPSPGSDPEAPVASGTSCPHRLPTGETNGRKERGWCWGMKVWLRYGYVFETRLPHSCLPLDTSEVNKWLNSKVTQKKNKTVKKQVKKEMNHRSVEDLPHAVQHQSRRHCDRPPGPQWAWPGSCEPAPPWLWGRWLKTWPSDGPAAHCPQYASPDIRTRENQWKTQRSNCRRCFFIPSLVLVLMICAIADLVYLLLCEINIYMIHLYSNKQ